MITGVLKNTWSIFLGIGFLMLGNGLQGTLISWRATFEGFSTSTTGLIMTAFYVGFLAGSFIAPRLVSRVGHIRVFAAMASMASAAILIQVIFISPTVWLVMRLLTGVCFASAYVVAESWLNASSNNKNRGQIMSIYMLVTLLGLAGGQWLLNLADPSQMTLFMLASILLSFALVPVLISRIKAPDIELSDNMSLLKLMKRAPSGSLTILFAAIAHGSVFGMGAVYASKSSMSVSDTVYFMTSFLVFGAALSWPIGWLSDRMDRRVIIVALSFFAILFCLFLFMTHITGALFILAFGGVGAMSMPLYSLGVTLTNDELDPKQIIKASGSIILMLGIGSMLGPISVGYVMELFSVDGYFLFLALMHGIISVATVFFIFKYPPIADEEITQYQAVPARATMVAMESFAQDVELIQQDEKENAI